MLTLVSGFRVFSSLSASLRYSLHCVVGVDALPAQITQSQAAGLDEAFLRLVHHALLEVRLCEGALVCPESGRRFPVANSIPNMLLREDEV